MVCRPNGRRGAQAPARWAAPRWERLGGRPDRAASFSRPVRCLQGPTGNLNQARQTVPRTERLPARTPVPWSRPPSAQTAGGGLPAPTAPVAARRPIRPGRFLGCSVLSFGSLLISTAGSGRPFGTWPCAPAVRSPTIWGARPRASCIRGATSSPPSSWRLPPGRPQSGSARGCRTLRRCPAWFQMTPLRRSTRRRPVRFNPWWSR